MRKYYPIFKNSIQEALVYRIETFASFFSEMLMFFLFFYVWTSIYETGDKIGSYNLKELLSYYFISRFLILTVKETNTAWMMAEEIRSGSLNIFLVQPIKYAEYLFFYSLGQFFYRIVVYSLSFGVIFYFARKIVVFSTEPRHLLFFVVFLLLGYLIQFLFFYTVGLLALWFKTIIGINFSLSVILTILDGSIIPLDLMPAYFQKINDFLPFKYVVFFPISLLSGKVEVSLFNFLIPLFWIIIFFFLSRLTFKMGLKHYEGSGI